MIIYNLIDLIFAVFWYYIFYFKLRDGSNHLLLLILFILILFTYFHIIYKIKNKVNEKFIMCIDGYKPAQAYDSYKSNIKGWCSDMELDDSDSLDEYKYDGDSSTQGSKNCLNSKRLQTNTSEESKTKGWCEIPDNYN